MLKRDQALFFYSLISLLLILGSTTTLNNPIGHIVQNFQNRDTARIDVSPPVNYARISEGARILKGSSDGALTTTANDNQETTCYANHLINYALETSGTNIIAPTNADIGAIDGTAPTSLIDSELNPLYKWNTPTECHSIGADQTCPIPLDLGKPRNI